jgi:hypothetical protein
VLLVEGCSTMITIPLSTEDLTRVRLAPSPLWETVTSFRVLLHQGRDTVHAHWATRAARSRWLLRWLRYITRRGILNRRS